jgi:aspartyl-tRNA(Asn)/glutamyl-tRNA(Gln) amidotransferase subunit A
MIRGLPFLNLVEIADAISSGALSSVEVTQTCLERIDSLQPVLNCFIEVNAEEALAAASKADAMLAKGDLIGALHGVPLAHKYIYYRAGKICSCGSRNRHSYVADRTATVIERLANAGALYLGRLNLSEFAIGPTGHNEHFGHCRNPWNFKHITGGSSSGSAASVAARLVYGALGSDTGGSIRIPAAFCGLVGIKPTYGRVSRYGFMPVSFSIDTSGPLARTVKDCARLLRIIAGYDPLDPSTCSHPVPDYEAFCGRDARGVRIGIPTKYGDIEVTPDIQKGFAKSLKAYESLDVDIIEIELPDFSQLNRMSEIVTRCEVASVHSTSLLKNRNSYSPQLGRRLNVGLSIPATWYIQALRLRGVLLESFHERVFGKCDVLMLPTVVTSAPTIEESDVRDSDQLPTIIKQMTWLTRPMNYLGLPTMSVPAGFTSSGLPLSFQLVGPPFSEALLFTVGHAYQDVTNWHTKVPPFATQLPAKEAKTPTN